MSDSPLQVTYRTRVWTRFVAYVVGVALATFVTMIVSVVGVLILMNRGVELSLLQGAIVEWLMEPPIFVLMILLGPSMFAVTATIGYSLSGESWPVLMQWKRPRASWGVCIALVIGSLVPAAISMKAAELLVELVPWMPYDDSFALFLKKVTPFWAVVFVIVIGMVPGFSEELFFRGYLQTRFVRRWGGWPAILVTSVLFGLAHGMPPNILLAFILGLYLGYVAWKCDSIWPAIATHVLINSGINAERMLAIFLEISEGTLSILNVVVLVPAGICLIYGVWGASKLTSASHPIQDPSRAMP